MKIVIHHYDVFKNSNFSDDDGGLYSVKQVVDLVEQDKEKYLKKNFPLSKIKNELKWWHKNYSLDNAQDKKRMLQSDTSFPLLVIKEDDELSIADGLNRLYKALNIEHKDRLDIYLVDKEDILHLNQNRRK